MKITPKYVIVDKDGYVKCGKKDINSATGWADGRYENGKWENNEDLVHRKSYITEGATCHYTWYVPQNPEGLFEVIRNSKPMDKQEKQIEKMERKKPVMTLRKAQRITVRCTLRIHQEIHG